MTKQDGERRGLRLALPESGARATPVSDGGLWERWQRLAKICAFIAALAIGYTEMRIRLEQARDELAALPGVREKAIKAEADKIAVLRRELKTLERALQEIERRDAATANELISRRQSQAQLRDEMQRRDSALQRQLDRLVDWYHERKSSFVLPDDG